MAIPNGSYNFDSKTDYSRCLFFGVSQLPGSNYFLSPSFESPDGLRIFKGFNKQCVFAGGKTYRELERSRKSTV